MASNPASKTVEADGVGNDNYMFKAENEASPQAQSLAPSLTGRLDISRFIYTPDIKDECIASPPRRSLRNLSTARGSALPSKSASTPARHVSPPKRTSDVTEAPRKRARRPPAPASSYAHLPPLPDRLAPDLLLLFIGLNPGITTSLTGHAYAHPSNLFWKLLHSSGITPRRCLPSEDVDLPRLFGIGKTNIVSRPTRNGSELTKAEMDAGVANLEMKIQQYRPECVVIVGKSIWESIWRVRHGRAITKEEFRYGWQEEVMGDVGKHASDDVPIWRGARVFVACSTSGLAATLKPIEKETIWNELGEWVNQRRKQKGIVAQDEDYAATTRQALIKPEQ